MSSLAPSVSVVIPVFNRSDLVVRAVRSCSEQGCAVEVVVVDDGSTEDIRAALLREFPGQMETDAPPIIRLIRQENHGACVARNTGLAEARGEFIKFLDSDDELVSGALAEEAQAARQTGCDALLTSSEERTYREDGTEDLSKRRSRQGPDLSHGIDDMLTGKAPWVSAALYRTSFVKPLRWDPAWTKAQDWGWALTVCLAGARFHLLDIPSFIRNRHSGVRIGNSGNPVIRSTQARQMLLSMVERELRSQNALTESRKRLLAQYYYRDCQILAQSDPQEWRRIWSHCRELQPGFRPGEPNRILRLLSRVAGVHAGVRLYVALKKAVPVRLLRA